MEANQDAVRLVKPYVDQKITEAVATAGAAATTAVATATQGVIKGKADALPAAADFVGQLFIRTGATDPGLYVATGTTTPGWKAVSHAN